VIIAFNASVSKRAAGAARPKFCPRLVRGYSVRGIKGNEARFAMTEETRISY